jgi:sugar phosphate isomerase/epimerase
MGISSAIFKKRMVGVREMAYIRECGFEHIKFSLNHGCVDYHNREQIDELIDECGKQGLAIASLHTSLIHFSSTDEDVRQEAMREGRLLIDTALKMGAGVVTSHFRDTVNARRSIEEMLKMIEGAPVIFGVENVGGFSRLKAMRLVDDFDHPQFKMLLDIGHTRDPDDGINPCVKKQRARLAVRECGDRLCAAHLHETVGLERVEGGKIKHMDHRSPFEENGMIEWGEVMAGLRDIDFSAPLIFEDGFGRDPKQWFAQAAKFPERFLERYG